MKKFFRNLKMFYKLLIPSVVAVFFIIILTLLSYFNVIIERVIAVSIIAIVASVLLNILMARFIVVPLREAINVIKKIAHGDLTQEISLTSRDEIGELAQAVKLMREKMSAAVGQSVVTSQVLSEASSDQASSLEETSSSLEEMAVMTQQNAENTARANDLMAEARMVTQKANESMSSLAQSMKEITQASEQTQKIVKTIDEIAFQTNLLALNAAVEAARAGDAGSGFAVVAEEVRNLAMRSAEAARNSTELMEEIVNKVKTGERSVEMTNETFCQVSVSSEKVVGLMEEIAAASQEQSQGIEQVNKAVAEMNLVTQQNAETAEELASIMDRFRTNHHAARELAEKAAAYMEANGKEKAIAEINNPRGQFRKGDLYIVAQGFNGVVYAHGANKALVGENHLEVKDPSGKYFVKEMVEIAKTKGGGWMQFIWNNPATNKAQPKKAWIRRVGGSDLFVLCGIFQ